MPRAQASTQGSSGNVKLDESDGLWATSYALIGPSEKAWAEVEELVRAAASRTDGA